MVPTIPMKDIMPYLNYYGTDKKKLDNESFSGTI